MSTNQDNRAFYLMMFCGLLLVKNSRAKLADLLPILPPAAPAQILAREITEALPS
jgi:hypothetical protein